MQGAFFYSGILALASGIFVRSFFAVGWVTIGWIALISFILVLWWYKKRLDTTALYLGLIVVMLVCFAGGLARMEWALKTNPSTLATSVGEKVELTGVVVTEPEVTAKSTRLTVLVDGERILVSTDRYATVAYGDEIKFSGKLKEPEAFETDFGRTFNYPGYLAVRDIFYLVSFATIDVTATGKGNPVLATLIHSKQRFLEQIKLVIPEPAVGLGAGLLLGVKSSLGEEIEEAFRTTGIIHIVVLSGANIMLIVIFLMYVLAFVVSIRTRAVLGIVSIILFALMVGFSATVVRASAMAVLIMLALLIGRQYAILRALFCAGIVMLLINPLLLVYDIGFQLSFLATVGLVLVAPQFEMLMLGVSSRFKLKEYFLATLSTQLAILPLLLYQIGQFSVVAILVNMAVLPMVPVAMLSTFITGVISFISPVAASVVAVIATSTLNYIIIIATKVAALPFAAFIVPQFPFIFVVVAYVMLGYGLYRYQAKVFFNTSIPNTSLLNDWTIVDEEELLKILKEREQSLRSNNDVQTLPIVFH